MSAWPSPSSGCSARSPSARPSASSSSGSAAGSTASTPRPPRSARPGGLPYSRRCGMPTSCVAPFRRACALPRAPKFPWTAWSPPGCRAAGKGQLKCEHCGATEASLVDAVAAGWCQITRRPHCGRCADRFPAWTRTSF
ncbi:hypothetical protein NKH18_00490 [Streptomyces sp. M10(2022)]